MVQQALHNFEGLPLILAVLLIRHFGNSGLVEQGSEAVPLLAKLFACLPVSRSMPTGMFAKAILNIVAWLNHHFPLFLKTSTLQKLFVVLPPCCLYNNLLCHVLGEVGDGNMAEITNILRQIQKWVRASLGPVERVAQPIVDLRKKWWVDAPFIMDMAMDLFHGALLTLDYLPLATQLFLAPSGPGALVCLIRAASVVFQTFCLTKGVMTIDGCLVVSECLYCGFEVRAEVVDVRLIGVMFTLDCHQDVLVDVLVGCVDKSDHIRSHSVLDHVHCSVKQL